jgi:ABC-type nitrate/sulfonate/bicarbonate transport system substrate-binding protein
MKWRYSVKIGKKSTWSAGVAIAFSTMLIATGCASDTESAAGDGKALEKIAVSMPVIPPNFVMVMPWVAQEQGFYKEFGLEVDIVSLDSGVTALRGAQAGSADIAAVPTPTLINAVGQGATVKGFYTYSAKLDVQMIVGPGINKCEDLKGKVLGVDEVGGFAEVLTKKYYTSCGLTQDDVIYGNFPGAEGQAIAQGQAVSGVLHIDEADAVIAQFPDAGMKSLVDLWDVVPDWHYAGFASTQEILDNRRDEIIAFTAANILAREFMADTANKETVLDIAEVVTGVSRPILSKTYDIFIASGLFPEGNGYPENMVNYTIDQQIELGNLDAAKKPAYGDIVDVSIYDAAIALVNARS